uniref:Prepilin-type N-terminal cleavage/methylation domain-containing protein n=1 Tax=candidate division CPR3 bacterium TaxID=2268181 RepID=A0A7C4R3W1_UNCC3
MKKNKEKGFTLIELLVVIAIIGILAAIGLSALTSARKKARDSRRKADLREIANALELYYADNGVYPSSNSWVDLVNNLKNSKYIDKDIYDPLASALTDARNSYKYCRSSDDLYYKMDTQLEVVTDTSADKDGGVAGNGLYEVGNGLGGNLNLITTGDCRKP